VTYQATLEVPEPLRAVMAAAMDGPSPGLAPGTTAWRFHMPQPIPPYLLALAAGNLAVAELGPRSAVYAEPEVLAKAAWEFAEVEAMIQGAEALYGPYPWDRFDLLVMPPAFPYGGMENPRLTFLTPTLLAGDRSLVNVVVHELAHSWSGNLVTNADMEHFWLNEGFTVYAERRILEALESPELAALQATVGRIALQREIDRLGATSPITRLRTELAGVDPDEAFSLVPYEKGFLLLARIERAVGRPRFDAFLRRYLDAFRFQSITTETFCAFLEDALPGVLAEVDAEQWLRQPGIPENEPRFQSDRRDAVAFLAAGWAAGARPDPEVTRGWSPEEWLIYLQGLPATIPVADCEALDRRFRLTEQGNAEILGAWLTVAAASGHEPAIEAALAFVGRMGRMKFLKPLYRALAACPAARDRALARFEALKHTYHPIARMVVQSALRGAGA
jgi:aminopeptidase N